MQYVDQFAEQVIVPFSDALKTHRVDEKEAAYFIAFLINPDLFKCMTNKPKRSNLLANLYSETIYKFSHQKNRKLFSNKLFYIMFEHFYNTGDFEQFCLTDETLSKNPDLYLKAAKENLDLFKFY